MINLTFAHAKRAKKMLDLGFSREHLRGCFQVNDRGLNALLYIATPGNRGDAWNLIRQILDNRETVQ